MTPDIALKTAKAALDKALEQKQLSREMIQAIGPAIIQALTPMLSEIATNSRISRQEIVSAISGIQINVPKVDVPQAEVRVEIPPIKVPQPIVNVTIPDIKVPEAKVTIPKITVPKPEVTVKIPEIKIPKFDIPEAVVHVTFPETMRAIIVDTNNKPVNLNSGSQAIVAGGGGGARQVSMKPYGTESAPVSVSTAGNNTIVAAVSGMRICVFGWMLQGQGTTSPKWTDGVKDLTGAYSFQAREGATSPTTTPPTFLFATGVGKPLILNLSDAQSVTGFVSYFLLP